MERTIWTRRRTSTTALCLLSVLAVSCCLMYPGTLPGALSGQLPDPATFEGRLPLVGGFRNGQAFYDWLGGVPHFIDAGNPLGGKEQAAERVRSFLQSRQGSDPMKTPRPAGTLIYVQGAVPNLGFTYSEAKDNSEAFREAWIAVAKVFKEEGVLSPIIGSSECNKAYKDRFYPGSDMDGWQAAWRHMVENVRSVLPDARFVFAPYQGEPDNGVTDLNRWWVSGFMDFMGCTSYWSARNHRYPKPEVVSDELCREEIAQMRDPTVPWSYGYFVAFAREKGVPFFIAETGIFDRDADRPKGMGDKPLAIDLMTQILIEDGVYAAVFFNSVGNEKGKKVDSRLDGKSNMPRAAQRVKELWGVDSPLR